MYISEGLEFKVFCFEFVKYQGFRFRVAFFVWDLGQRKNAKRGNYSSGKTKESTTQLLKPSKR